MLTLLAGYGRYALLLSFATKSVILLSSSCSYSSLVTLSMPAALLPFIPLWHCLSISSSNKCASDVNLSLGLPLAISAILSSFVSILLSPLCVSNVSPSRAMLCYCLSSTGITLLHRYYAVIRLPASHLASLLFLSLVSHTPFEEPSGPPGLPYYINVQRAKVSDPGEAKAVSPLRPL